MIEEFAKMCLEWLKDNLNPTNAGRIVAFLVVPGGILVLVLSGVFGDSMRWDLSRPVTISKLQTELSSDGSTSPKPGVALIFEPASADHHYNFQFQSAPKRLWTSLEGKTATANREHLTLGGGGVIGTTPFDGTHDPVTVVVEGEMDDTILISNGKIKGDNWQLPSRRSESLVACVLLSCAIGFGISVARGFPSPDRTQNTAG